MHDQTPHFLDTKVLRKEVITSISARFFIVCRVVRDISETWFGDVSRTFRRRGSGPPFPDGTLVSNV